jgi:hypothetical protein
VLKESNFINQIKIIRTITLVKCCGGLSFSKSSRVHSSLRLEGVTCSSTIV